MNNQKFISITSKKKKHRIITGTLSLPLKLGDRAWICYGNASGRFQQTAFCLKHITLLTN